MLLTSTGTFQTSYYATMRAYSTARGSISTIQSWMRPCTTARQTPMVRTNIEHRRPSRPWFGLLPRLPPPILQFGSDFYRGSAQFSTKMVRTLIEPLGGLSGVLLGHDVLGANADIIGVNLRLGWCFLYAKAAEKRGTVVVSVRRGAFSSDLDVT